MKLALLLLAAGCGRLAFDASPDAAIAVCANPAGHDEDGDGVDDACDVCPHLADDGRDRDGDGVGDACDPNPDEARDRIAFFDPFTSQRPEWRFSSLASATANYLGDSAELDSRGGQFRGDLLEPPVDDTYIMGVHLGAGSTARQHQVAMYALEKDKRLYYCDLDSVMGTDAWQETYTRDATSYFRIVGGDANQPVENGDLVMTMRVTPGLLQCATTWPVDTPMLDGVPPADIMPIMASFSFIGLDVEMRWFIHIASTPP